MDRNLSSRLKPTRESAIVTSLLIIVGIGLLYLSTRRQIGSYGVETDFYGSFAPEGRRLLAGKPLTTQHHPPLYPALLTAVYSLLRDWFRAGLLISVFSGALALGASFRVSKALFGKGVAVAAALALVAWPDFLKYSVTASSDMLFLSLMLLSMAVAVGGDLLSTRRAFVAGFLAALASLTRTNGITLVTVALICASRMEAGRRLRACIICLAGFALPWTTWALLAGVSGSHVLPTQNYVDIAVAFFNPAGRQSSFNSDNWPLAQARFSSLADVVLYDPRVLVAGFVKNLLRNWWNLFDALSPKLLPFAGVCSFGLAYLALHKRDAQRIAFWLVLLSQYAILGLKDFNSRYYLFLVPAIGAGAYAAGRLWLDSVRIPKRAQIALIAVGVAAVAVLTAAVQARRLPTVLNEDAREVLEASSVLGGMSTTGDRIIARKPHLVFHTGLDGVPFPVAASLDDLYRELCPTPPTGRTLLFYGRAEAALRPGLRSLRTPAHAPDWLIPLGFREPVGTSWVLYDVHCKDRLSSSPPLKSP